MYAVDTSSDAARLVMRDVQIQQVACGVRLKSNLFTLDTVEVRFFKAASGVGFEIDQTGLPDGVGEMFNCVTETAGGGSSPFAGCLVTCASGIQFTDCDFMQSGRGMAIAPGNGQQVVSINCSNTYFDTSVSGGLTIYPTGTGNVARLRFNNCWFCSATGSAGIDIGPGVQVSGLMVSDSEFYDSLYGVRIGDGAVLSKVMFSDCVYAGNVNVDFNVGANVSKWSLRDCEMGAASGFSATPLGLFIGAGCDDYTVFGNRIPNGITDNSTPTNREFARNRGIKTKNYGQVTTSTTSTVVNHGLYKQPSQDQIRLTFESDPAAVRYWVSATTATTFTIAANSAAATIIGWQADIEY